MESIQLKPKNNQWFWIIQNIMKKIKKIITQWAVAK